MRKILEGNKVFFRLVEEKDLAKRVEWINDPDVQRYLHFDYPTSFARTKKWFDKIVFDKTRVDFSIFEKQSNEYIGFCGFINIDVPVLKAEFYAVIGDKNYWKRGYGTEVYILLTNYGFLELGLSRIYAYLNTENNASLKTFKKIGWKVEGTLRKDIFAHGKIYDRNVVSILRNEWENNNVYDI